MRTDECREIYKEAFFDPDIEFEENLFSLCEEYLETYEENGKTVSMLFALPCELLVNGTKKAARYIYAAATKEEHRRKGYMKLLLERKKESGEILFLKPVKDELFSYYGNLGFRKIKATASENRLIPKHGFASLALDFPEETETYMMVFGEEDIEDIYFPFIME